MWMAAPRSRSPERTPLSSLSKAQGEARNEARRWNIERLRKR